MVNPSWYYHDGQKQVGPLQENALRLMIEHGIVGADQLVFGPGMKEWKPAHAVSLARHRPEAALPPTPTGQDVTSRVAASPTPPSGRPVLWNPSAAASWCLLFGAPFGSFLHAKNWTALGEHGKSRNSWIWFFTTSTAILLTMLASPPVATGIAIWALILWYFISGRTQIAFVESRFGSNGYERKSWVAPLLVALALSFFLFVIGVFIVIAQAVAQA